MNEPKSLTEILNWYIDTPIKSPEDKTALVRQIEKNIREHNNIVLEDGTIYNVSFRPEDLIKECSRINCVICGVNNKK